MPYKDPKEQREYSRKYAHRPKQKARRKAYSKKWWKENREHVAQYGQDKMQKVWSHKARKGCQICGEKDPIVLDLHHRDPTTKRFTIGRGRSWSLQNLLTEIEKCDVLCANCHRRVEWKLRQEKEDA